MRAWVRQNIPGARLCVSAALLLLAGGCAKRERGPQPVEAASPAPAAGQAVATELGALEGKLGGRPLVVRAALFTASDLGELVLAIADTPFTCAEQEAGRNATPERAIFIFLADLKGPSARPRDAPLAAHAGLYSVIHFLDFRAAWFEAAGEAPRPGLEGGRPPDGSYAAILSSAGGAAAGKGGNWPIGVAGGVTLDRFPAGAGERVTGTIDANFESGESLTGRFSAEACPKLFASLARPQKPRPH